jgi:hypothetical protein
MEAAIYLMTLNELQFDKFTPGRRCFGKPETKLFMSLVGMEKRGNKRTYLDDKFV